MQILFQPEFITSRMITRNVLRSPARRTSLIAGIPKLESAPVSAKRVELNLARQRLGYGR